MDVYLGKRKTIIVTDEGISTRNIKIGWDEILGIQKCTESIFYQLSSRLPMFILLLKGGRSFRVNRWVCIEGVGLNKYEDSYKSKFPLFFTLLELIERRASRIGTFSGWFPWRALAPTFILQPPIMIGSYIFHGNQNLSTDISQSAFATVLLASIVLVFIGLGWERYARKKYWR